MQTIWFPFTEPLTLGTNSIVTNLMNEKKESRFILTPVQFIFQGKQIVDNRLLYRRRLANKYIKHEKIRKLPFMFVHTHTHIHTHLYQRQEFELRRIMSSIYLVG